MKFILENPLNKKKIPAINLGKSQEVKIVPENTLEHQYNTVFGVQVMVQRCKWNQLKQSCGLMSDNQKSLYYRPWHQN